MAPEKSALYIHIPYCISKCAYCDFFSVPKGNTESKNIVPDNYLDALCNEIAYRLGLNKISRLKTIYIGGGTPSLLTPAQFQKIFSKIKSSTRVLPDAEITVEVNPDDVSSELLDSLSQCGVNRISCGLQSMNEAALHKACRRADLTTNRKALSIIKEYWKGETSFDLISGLPGEDEKCLLTGLEEVVSYNPSHISLYSLTIEEKTPFGKQLEAGLLDYDFDFADKLWLAGRDFLESCGYKWYEVSNFCRPGKECLHNLVYWTHGGYLGCGSAACGTIYHEDGTGERWTNTTNIEEYISRWLSSPEGVSKPQSDESSQTYEAIDLPTSQFEFFMMGLRKLEGISEAEYKAIFGEELPEKFVRLFSQWEEKGLCVRHGRDMRHGCEGGGRYAMSREGMLFLNRFNMELL